MWSYDPQLWDAGIPDTDCGSVYVGDEEAGMTRLPEGAIQMSCDTCKHWEFSKKRMQAGDIRVGLCSGMQEPGGLAYHDTQCNDWGDCSEIITQSGFYCALWEGIE